MKLAATKVTVELEARRIVRDVTLAVEPGQMVGLIGPNGSGKSTFLRTVYRLLKPAAGCVTVDGSDVWRLSASASARLTGVVVQEAATDFEFTVREMVRMGRIPHKRLLTQHNRNDEEIVVDVLRQVRMLAFADRPFSTLSGGEKQRVLIARALAQQPKLLVLDEATNHLDIHHQFGILDLLNQLGTTTLMTLHDMNLAAAYCHRLYVISEGQIVAAGRPEEVLTPALLRRVFRIDAAVACHPATGRLHLAFMPLMDGAMTGPAPEVCATSGRRPHAGVVAQTTAGQVGKKGGTCV